MNKAMAATQPFTTLMKQAYNHAYAEGYKDGQKHNPTTKLALLDDMVPGKIYRVTIEGIARMDGGYYGNEDLGIYLASLKDNEEIISYYDLEQYAKRVEEF